MLNCFRLIFVFVIKKQKSDGFPKVLKHVDAKQEVMKIPFLIYDAKIPYGYKNYILNINQEWRYFSLHFPLVPEGTKNIDLIEKETEKIDPAQFNFYSISLNEASKQYKIAPPEL
jgi:hypothetical protein